MHAVVGHEEPPDAALLHVVERIAHRRLHDLSEDSLGVKYTFSDSTDHGLGSVLMKSRKHSTLFALCAAAAFLAGLPSLHAQLADLPIKPGLWETQVTSKVGTMGMIGPVSAQSCFSAGTTLGDYLTATNKGTPGAQCSVSNKVQTAHGISYDTTCTSQSMASKGHIDFQLPDAEHFSGTSHTTVTGTTQGRPINTAIRGRNSRSSASKDRRGLIRRSAG